MPDPNEVIDQAEVDAVEHVEDDAEVADDESPETEESADDDDSEEIDYEGAKYRIPKALKKGIMLNADYTQKTQTLAEQRRALEQQQESFRRSAQMQAAYAQQYGKLSMLDSQLQQYSGVNWNDLYVKDPEAARKHQFNFTALRQERERVAGEVANLSQQALHAQQAETAKRVEASRAELLRAIPGWDSTTAREITEHALAKGLSESTLRVIHEAQIPDAVQIIALLHENLKMTKALEKAKQVNKTVDVTPNKKVASKKSAVPNIYKPMSTKDFVELRNKQLKAK